MNMNALQDFISVITHGSFSAASRATMTPKASISRRIRQLEDELQTRLFERTNTGFTLTAEGTLLFERIKPLVNELNDIKTDMMEQTGSPSGKLRISVPPVIAFDTLGKLAARYRELYPLVELELIADSRLVDPIREGFDAVIRVNPMADQEMIGIKIFKETLIFVASPQYREQLALGDPLTELPFISIGTHWKPNQISTVLEGEPRHFNVNTELYISSPFITRSTLISGVGSALLPEALVADDIKAGRLLHLGVSEQPELILWCLYPSRRYVTGRLRAFIDLLKETFSQESSIHH
ncbi:MAG: LysR family transcriptional regulator [Serratia liquefaciens]|uniref:LysR family transcriptional regulator n=1 Tax=Serratia liquefaciens TaxID=614 RepID=UPI00217739C5|nr:LysR family transcriptional regulator [Serratia liquefaciens]MDU5486692.1 LysR family transcriptional regulator [Serratia liquefaciens]CAI1020268.1 HTH-type transcriptional regulator gltR [Serratia liquefaciens]HEJ7038998.1 LysR family transcriptional regulator [Serratia liquefaciens]